MSGFTLLELITAMTVLAILVSIAIPSFANLTRANQIAAASNELVTALTLARSESVKRGIRVSVCASDGAAEPACSGEATWANGWVVFTDDNGGAGAMDPGDEPLQSWRAPAAGVIVEGVLVEGGAPAAAVTFTRMGNAAVGTEFAVTKDGCSENQLRSITVAPTGRVAIQRAPCS